MGPANLARSDAAGIPTYLEASNPRNSHRYQRQGCVPIGQVGTALRVRGGRNSVRALGPFATAADE